MTITMASAAISSADPETTSLATMPATRMATKLAWKAGWALNVTKVCVGVPGGLTSSWWLSLWVSCSHPPAIRWLSWVWWDLGCFLGLKHKDAVGTPSPRRSEHWLLTSPSLERCPWPSRCHSTPRPSSSQSVNGWHGRKKATAPFVLTLGYSSHSRVSPGIRLRPSSCWDHVLAQLLPLPICCPLPLSLYPNPLLRLCFLRHPTQNRCQVGLG